MKNLLSLMLVLVLCLSAAACSAGPKQPQSVPSEENTAAPETHAPSETAAPESSASAESAETAAPEVPRVSGEVTVSLDNWEQFFELREVTDIYEDESGKVQEWSFEYGVFLRRDLMDRFVSGEINFEVQFDTQIRKFTGDSETGRYALGESVETARPSAGITKTFGLEDLRADDTVSQCSGFFGAVVGRVHVGGVQKTESGMLTAEVPVNGVILHAEGTLVLN